MPGKFDGPISEFLYSLSLNGGADEECGSSTEGSGWYGLLSFADMPIAVTQDQMAEFGLSADDVETLQKSAGAILCEDCYGFVGAALYDDASELESAWNRIADELETSCDEEI